MKPHRLIVAGFGAFARRAEVDFDRLDEHGLYLIVGETGAGKTTVFDAMTFALYGEVAGNRDKGTVSSDYENRDNPYVEFEFSHKSRRFIIKRLIESNDKSDNSISEIDTSGKAVDTKTGKNEVKKFVEELIGLDAEQFMKVVLLPQGKFQDFLVAKSSDREKLLQVLFGTRIYEKVTDSMVERAQRKVIDAEKILQGLLSDENAAQQILDQLANYGLDGEVPRLENGYGETLGDLQSRKSVADDSAKKLGAAQTDAAKKLQAVEEDAELFEADAALKEVLELDRELAKQVGSSKTSVEGHLKAEPVKNAYESEKAASRQRCTGPPGKNPRDEIWVGTADRACASSLSVH